MAWDPDLNLRGAAGIFWGMARVVFTSHLARHLPCAEGEYSGDTVAEVLASVFTANPPLRSYLVDEQWRLRQHVNVFVAGEPVRDRVHLSDAVRPNDEVYVLQALSGG